MSTNYGEAIRFGFEYLLDKYQDFTVFGQGLWSPWYVGNTMTDLDKKFGKDRVIDSPVSELACTGAAVEHQFVGKNPCCSSPNGFHGAGD